MKHLDGREIQRRSFEIVLERLGSFEVDEDTREIVIRIAHTTGDVEFAKTFLFSPGGVAAGVAAIRAGGNVVTDVRMVHAGIRAANLESWGGTVRCFLNGPEAAERARSLMTTRSALGMRDGAEAIDGGIVAIGNAPTALFELLEMIEEGVTRPALVVGVPVGFVGALESKVALSEADIPFITVLSERGGSPIAAGIVNGLLALAGGAGEGGRS